MAISYIKTEKVNELGKNIVNLSNELESLINSLYDRFSNVPNVTGEWIGNQAVKYFNIVSYDKKKYLNFADKLKKFGYALEYDANSVVDCISVNIKEESGDSYD